MVVSPEEQTGVRVGHDGEDGLAESIGPGMHGAHGRVLPGEIANQVHVGGYGGRGNAGPVEVSLGAFVRDGAP